MDLLTDKQFDFLLNQPNVQIRSLHWFLEWRKFELSRADILDRLVKCLPFSYDEWSIMNRVLT